MSAELRHDVDLSRYTTLGCRSLARRYLAIDRDEDLDAAAIWVQRERGPVSVLAGGSNVLPATEIDGLTLHVRTRGVSVVEEGETVRITAAAGENWHGLVRRTLGLGLTGLECLSLIPGSVGAAPIQNIGAYGAELGDTLAWVDVFDLHSGRSRRMLAAECELSYRDSVFRRQPSPGTLIFSVTLRLTRCGASLPEQPRYPDVTQELERLGVRHPSPIQMAEAVIRVRRRKLPDWRRIGNVGSVFKNPVVPRADAETLLRTWPALKSTSVQAGVRLSAAQLIDLAGLKRLAIKGARPWPRQPLVLTLARQQPPAPITAFDELIGAVQAAVANHFGVALEIEPQRLPTGS
ncbi:MAG: UDP-N-acetylmuramate dehydrogenase [Pseudomonadota bacterium]